MILDLQSIVLIIKYNEYDWLNTVIEYGSQPRELVIYRYAQDISC